MSFKINLRWDRVGIPERPVIVLAPSLGSDIRVWEAQIPALVGDFDVVRFEYPGHGEAPSSTGPSSLDELAESLLLDLDREGVQSFNIAGISLGGMVAMTTALLAPDRVRRVAAFCTSANLKPAEYWVDRAERVLAAGTAGCVAEDIVSRWFTAEYAADHPQVVAEMIAMISACDPMGYAGCCQAIATMDLADRIQEITAPLIAVAALADRTTPGFHLESIAKQVQSGEFHLIEGAHLVTVENPHAVNRLLLDHFG